MEASEDVAGAVSSASSGPLRDYQEGTKMLPFYSGLFVELGFKSWGCWAD